MFSYSTKDKIEIIITADDAGSSGYYMDGNNGFFFNKEFNSNDIIALFQNERCTTTLGTI